jgi:cell division protein FtsB
MNPAWPLKPRRRIGIVLLAMLAAILYAFLSGPSGFVSILIHQHRRHHLQTEIAGIKDRIAARAAQRQWLSNPDSAKLLARRLLAPDSTPTGPGN